MCALCGTNRNRIAARPEATKSWPEPSSTSSSTVTIAYSPRSGTKQQASTGKDGLPQPSLHRDESATKLAPRPDGHRSLDRCGRYGAVHGGQEVRKLARLGRRKRVVLWRRESRRGGGGSSDLVRRRALGERWRRAGAEPPWTPGERT